MMLNLESRTEFCDHSIIEISVILHDNPFGDAILTDNIMLNESSHNILNNGGK